MWQNFSYSQVLPNRFTSAECLAIIDYHTQLPANISRFDRADGEQLRDSYIHWLYHDDNTRWVFERLGEALRDYNAGYGFDVKPWIDSAQLTQYRAGQQYGWHVDIGPREMSLRKISMVVELSDPASHEGGGLEVFNGDCMENRLTMQQGDIACFCSFMQHRARPVTRGERWSLVCWVLGERPLR
jgi:PKHD-type hydroxylase